MYYREAKYIRFVATNPEVCDSGIVHNDLFHFFHIFTSYWCTSTRDVQAARRLQGLTGSLEELKPFEDFSFYSRLLKSNI